MNTAYKLSGKSGNIFILGILLTPILLTVLCLIYAYIDVNSHKVFILFFLAYLGFLLGILLIQNLIIKLSKCRNKNSSILYGLIVGCLGIYLSWCTFIYVTYQKENHPLALFEIIFNPTLIYEMAKTLSINGYYNLFGTVAKGGFLLLIWIIKALGILVAGVISGYVSMHKEIYCEDCKRWIEDINFDLRLAFEDKESTLRMIESDINNLLVFPKYESTNSEHLRVNLHQCSKCLNTSIIDVDLMKYITNDNQEVEEKSEYFSKMYVINTSQFNKFINQKNQSKS